MKTLELIGKTAVIAGNTYHVASATLDGKLIAKVDFSYGYDEQWLYNLIQELNAVDCGLPKLENYTFGTEQPYAYIDRLKTLGYAVTKSVSQVKGRKNLVV
jgi:hypothetical protein